MIETWQLDLQVEAESVPRWDGGIPWCCEMCPQHDEKRCRILGVRPDSICEPTVRAMASKLREASG